MKKTISIWKSSINYASFSQRASAPLLRAVLLLCGLLTLTACQQAITLPEASLDNALMQQSRIIETKTGKPLTADALVSRLSQAPLLIIGEEHTNPLHHLIEQWLLERLAQQRPQGSVLMEMFSIDQQPRINEVKRAMAAGSYLREPRIQELLLWHSGWPWSLYRGLVLSALQGNYPLIAANLDQQQVKALLKTARFPPGERSTSKAVRDFLTKAIVASHGGGASSQSLPAQQLTAMLAVQQNRDRFMAEQLLRAPRPALLVAGNFHTVKNIGVPLHMEDLRGDKPVVLMLLSKDSRVTRHQADYFWTTPKCVPCLENTP